MVAATRLPGKRGKYHELTELTSEAKGLRPQTRGSLADGLRPQTRESLANGLRPQTSRELKLTQLWQTRQLS
jgi:hypothetical protein